MSRESFRCYIEGTGNRWKSYCAEVDLGASGSTPGQARLELERLLERYCHERDEGTPAAQAVRRAAVQRQLGYWLTWLRSGSSQAGMCYVFHAPPQMLVGLA